MVGENRRIVSTKEAFNLIYDYLKRKRILREFVEASYEYHMNENAHLMKIKPFGRENTKEIISYNIERYCCQYGRSLSQMFISFGGSFEWSNSRQGAEFWRLYLDIGWKEYLNKKFGCDIYFK